MNRNKITPLTPQRISDYVLAQRQVVTPAGVSAKMGISKHTAECYLSRLAKKGILFKQGRGRYVPTSVDRHDGAGTKRLQNWIRKDAPYTPFATWTTGILAPYMHDMMAHELVFIESPKEAISTIKDIIIAHGGLAIANPSKKELESVYDWPEGTAMIFSSRGGYGPVHQGKYATVRPEKAVADLYFLATRRHLPFPLAEVGSVLKGMLERGTMDSKYLMRYATRRNMKTEFEAMIERISVILGIINWPSGDAKTASMENVNVDAVVQGALR